MKIKALYGVAVLGLCLSSLPWVACGRDSAIQVRHDSQGNDDIHIDKKKIQDNLHQAGQELKKGADDLGSAVQRGAHDLDQKAGPSARESVDDAALTTKVKARLIATPDLGGIRIHVNSRDGQVTLSGTVATQENRLRAEQIAHDTDGVHAVTNELHVGPVS